MLFGVRADGKAFLFQAQGFVSDFEQLQNVEGQLADDVQVGLKAACCSRGVVGVLVLTDNKVRNNYKEFTTLQKRFDNYN